MENLLKSARGKISETAFSNLEKWLREEKFAEFREEISKIIALENWDELNDAFFKNLDFGTAGRRGKFGAGANRINKITVAETIQALCEYFRAQKIENPSAAIGFDVRNSSLDLAKSAAEVFAENGVKVFFFGNPRSTPEISFAVRNLKISAGVVISASHNPPRDNGIKIFWGDGAQISHPHDKKIAEIFAKNPEIRSGNFAENLKNGKIEILGEKIDKNYISAILRNSKSSARSVKIAFSPLHGTGRTNLLPVLFFAGFEKIAIPQNQFEFDGNFSSVPKNSPNPENFEANQIAIDLLRAENCDIALTTDPDADRICVISKEKNGEIRTFSGNETAILAADFLLSKMKNSPDFEKFFIAKTFVTTDALNALAKKYGAKIYDDFLVGFKFIGRKIREKQIEGEIFLAGFEESLGGLVGDYARDKDAASVGLAICELASELKNEGRTLGEKLEEIYREIGFFVEKTVSVEFSGESGFEKMREIMRKMRAGEIDFGATTANDFLNLRRKNLETGEISKIEILEAGDALSFEFGRKERRISIRPSGTEAKIKIYAQWIFENPSERAKIDSILNEFKEKIL